MRDTEVVASIVARDPAGVGEAYDRYAARIFSFCRSLLGEPADAADAVEATFVIAAVAVPELHDPGRLRPWLYAVARNECHRRLRDGAPPAGRGEAAGADGEADDVYDIDRAQPLDLVRAAILGLDLDDQEVVELSLRHRLHGADLADPLGMPRHQVSALASQARRRLEAALGVLVVTQVGRKACPDLDALLSEADGSSAARARRQVSAHVAACAVCGDRQRQVVGPVMKLGFAPLGPIPSELRDRVVYLTTNVSPATAAQRDAIAARAGQFGPYGFPIPETSTAGTGRWWRAATKPVTAIAGAAATAAVAAIAAVVILVVPEGSHATPSALPANLSSPAGSASASGQGVQPAAAGGASGSQSAPASGNHGNAATVRIQGSFAGHHASGALAIQAGSLQAVSGTKNGTVSKAASHPAPATKTSSPATTKKSTPPVVSTSPKPTGSPAPVTSPTPVISPTPVTSPTTPPPSSPPPSTTPPSQAPSSPGPSVSMTVGQLLTVGVSLGS